MRRDYDLDSLSGDGLGPLTIGASNAGTSLVGNVTLSVELEELLEIKLGALEDLDLVEEDVLEGVDGLASLLNLLSNGIGDELLDDLLKGAARDLTLDDLEHTLADSTDLAGLSVSGLLDLLGATLGETNGKETKQVTISGLDVNVGLNKGLPLLNHGTELISGHGHTVEVGQASLALNLIDTKTELAESLILALGVQVTEGDIKNTTTKVIISVLQALSAVDEGLTEVTDGEAGGSLDVVPVLAGEGIDDLLLESLLSLGKTLVLANSLHKNE